MSVFVSKCYDYFSDSKFFDIYLSIDLGKANLLSFSKKKKKMYYAKKRELGVFAQMQRRWDGREKGTELFLKEKKFERKK